MKKSILVLFIVIAFVLTACGGSSGPSTTINVTMTDFMFTPTQWTIPAGQTITVNAVNNGAVIHNFVVFKLGTGPGDKFDSEDEPNIFWKLETQPGQSTTETFTAPTEPGTYVVACSTPGHVEAGMLASLIVK